MTLYNQLLAFAEKHPGALVANKSVTGFVTFKYLHGGVDFTNPLLRMSRGLTFTTEGQLVVRGFEKFFNYKQLQGREDLSEQFILERSDTNVDPSKPLTFYEKLDGSLILLGVHNDEFFASTTSSCHNTHTEIALNWFNRHPNAEILKNVILNNDVTLAFEYISPLNQVVVKYEETDFVLIGIINNKTGRRYSYDEMEILASKANLTLPNVYRMTLIEAIALQQTLENSEGFIFENEYGNLLKFKTAYWFDMHPVADTFFNAQLTRSKIEKILTAFKEDELDDLLAFQNQNAELQKADIIGRVIGPLNQLLDEVAATYHNTISLSDREFAALDLDPTVKALTFTARKNTLEDVLRLRFTKTMTLVKQHIREVIASEEV